MSCDQCVNFQSLPPWKRIQLPSRESFGKCRRRPPVVSKPTEDRSGQTLALFPTVRTKDWCGEFIPHADRVRDCCRDDANAALDAASHDDATDADVTRLTSNA